MTVNERVKEVRNALNLTQSEFGSKLTLAQTYLSQIEKGDRAVTDKILKLICLQYGVDEEWLRTGNGDMFKQENAEAVDDKFEALAAEYGLTDLQVELIRTILKFPDNTQKSVVQFICDLADAVSNEDAADKPNGGDDGETGK